MLLEKTVKVNKKHFYETYVELCRMHDFPALHFDNIDEILVYYKDNIIMYSCLLWNTGSKMCLIGFPTSNLSVKSYMREGLLSKFISDIVDYAKKKDYNLIWTTSSTDRVIESLKENGFQKGDENVQTYIKVTS